jgi:hypothetical protein
MSHATDPPIPAAGLPASLTSTPSTPATLSRVASIAAGLVLVFYGILSVWMLSIRGTTGTAWDHASFIYSGLEAIVFAAAGALFGTHVQRGSVADAKDRASKAESDRADAEDEKALAMQGASNGAALAEAVRATRGASDDQSQVTRSQPQVTANEPLSQLVAIADKLFPPGDQMLH